MCYSCSPSQRGVGPQLSYIHFVLGIAPHRLLKGARCTAARRPEGQEREWCGVGAVPGHRQSRGGRYGPCENLQSLRFKIVKMGRKLSTDRIASLHARAAVGSTFSHSVEIYILCTSFRPHHHYSLHVVGSITVFASRQPKYLSALQHACGLMQLNGSEASEEYEKRNVETPHRPTSPAPRVHWSVCLHFCARLARGQQRPQGLSCQIGRPSRPSLRRPSERSSDGRHVYRKRP